MNNELGQKNELPRRVKLVAWINFFFAIYLFSHSYNASAQGFYWQGMLFFLAFLCLSLGGYYLLEGRSFGKSLSQISGFICILMLIYFSCRYVPYFFDPRYPFERLFDSVQHDFFLYFLRTFYPIIVGFLILNKPNDELKLK